MFSIPSERETDSTSASIKALPSIAQTEVSEASNQFRVLEEAPSHELSSDGSGSNVQARRTPVVNPRLDSLLFTESPFSQSLSFLPLLASGVSRSQLVSLTLRDDLECYRSAHDQISGHN